MTSTQRYYTQLVADARQNLVEADATFAQSRVSCEDTARHAGRLQETVRQLLEVIDETTKAAS